MNQGEIPNDLPKLNPISHKTSKFRKNVTNRNPGLNLLKPNPRMDDLGTISESAASRLSTPITQQNIDFVSINTQINGFGENYENYANENYNIGPEGLNSHGKLPGNYENYESIFQTIKPETLNNLINPHSEQDIPIIPLEFIDRIQANSETKPNSNLSILNRPMSIGSIGPMSSKNNSEIFDQMLTQSINSMSKMDISHSVSEMADKVTFEIDGNELNDFSYERNSVSQDKGFVSNLSGTSQPDLKHTKPIFSIGISPSYNELEKSLINQHSSRPQLLPKIGSSSYKKDWSRDSNQNMMISCDSTTSTMSSFAREIANTFGGKCSEHPTSNSLCDSHAKY